MNLSELQSVQARERQSDSLQELRPSFYQDAADYVAELREERTRVAAEADEPFENPRVTQLTDDIRTAQGTIEAIYERRVGKVVKLASLAAADMPTEETGLTTEEQELYETLVGAIESHREDVLATLAEEGQAPGPDGSPTTNVRDGDGNGPEDGDGDSNRPGNVDRDGNGNGDRDGNEPPDADRPTTEASAAAGPDDGVDAAEVMAPESGGPSGRDDPAGATVDATDDGDGGAQGGSGGERSTDDDDAGGEEASAPAGTNGDGSAVDASSGEDTERTTVRITEDVGAILAVDEREYDLAADDVVTLPAENAAPLIERDAAEPLE